MTSSTDDRSPSAKAYQWSTRIMVVSLEMVLPGVAGYWIDRRLNIIFPVFLLMGLVGGCIGGVWHLMRLTRIDARHDDRDGKRDSTRE